MRRSRTNAFTLVELLVVIGIIAVLLGILMPSLNRARTYSKAIACRSNLRQIGQSMIIYANANKGYLFPPENGLIVPMNERWFVYVLKPIPPVDPTSLEAKDWTPPIMLCPGDAEPANYHSYLVNHHLVEHGMVYSSKPPSGLTTSSIVVAGEKITQSTNYYVENLPRGTTYYEQVEKYRHGARLASNYLFLDLHVDNNGPIEKKFKEWADPWDLPDTGREPTTQGT
jgi:prepilin-type N-terminal cleavage/methylation domain-containing protein/prepilin-type processing-associated H-X9-DG protein